MTILKTFCCACTLKTGTLIIGYIMLAISLLGLWSTYFGYVPIQPRNEKIVTIVCCVFETIISAMLVIGSRKKFRWLLLPWIALNIVGTIISVIVFVVIIHDRVQTFNNEDRATNVIVAVVIAVPIVGLIVYLLLVVTSHYQELEATAMEEQSNLLPMHLTTNHRNSYASTTANALSNVSHSP